MPARGADRVHGDQHPRAGNLAGRDRIAQADIDIVARSHIAHRREAGHQSTAHDIHSVERALRDVLLQRVQFLDAVVALVRVGQVRVRVDKAGQQRRIAQIDRLGARRKCRLGARRDDLTVGDHDQPG